MGRSACYFVRQDTQKTEARMMWSYRLNGGSTAEKNAELVHTRRRVKDVWKVKLKERDPEGEDTANALRRHNKI